MNYAELLASNTCLNGEVLRKREELKIAHLTIEKLKTEIAYLRRMKFGSTSEHSGTNNCFSMARLPRVPRSSWRPTSPTRRAPQKEASQR